MTSATLSPIARFISRFSLIGSVTVLFFGFIHLQSGHTVIAVSEILVGLLAILNLVFFHFRQNDALAATVVLTLMFALLFILLQTGGLADTGVFWFFTFPVLAFFLKGRLTGALWTGFLLAGLGMASILSAGGVINLPYPPIGLRQLFVSLLVISLLLYVYQTERERAENSVLQTTAQLRQANEDIRKEIARGQEGKKAAVQLAAIVEHASDAMISLTMDGAVETWNGGAERIYGFTRDEAVGKSFPELVGPVDNNPLQQLFHSVTEDHPITNQVLRHQRKHGEHITVSLGVTIIRMPYSRSSKISLIIRDITEEERQRERLEERTQELERLNKTMIGRELQMIEMKQKMKALKP